MEAIWNVEIKQLHDFRKCENPLIDISIFKNIPFTCQLVAFF